MGSPSGVILLGTARDGLRPLEATLPSTFHCGRAKRRQSEARHRQTPGRDCVRALSASPHDEISPKRHRQRLEAPAYVRQRIDDLYGTLIRTVAKTAPF